MRLCELTDQCQDPCVLDVFTAVIRYLEGGGPKLSWWTHMKSVRGPINSKTLSN